MDSTYTELGDSPADRGRTATTRRGFLAAVGGAAAASLAGCTGQSPPHGWIEMNPPSGGALYDVVVTSAGPVAVGEGGRIVARTDDAWRTVLEGGPGGNGTDLRSAARTDDARRVWTVGSSGVVARFDAANGQVQDFSAPNGKTSSWAAVAATGRSGSERLHLINTSGELLSGRMRDGAVQWGSVSKPTGGESATAIEYDGGMGYIGDTAGGVYRYDGDAWTPVGLRGVDSTVKDLATGDGRLVTAVTDDGAIRLFTGRNWHELVTSESALHAVSQREERGVAAGVDGTVFELGDNGWVPEETPTSKTLHGADVGGDEYTDVVVGANGVVMERFG